jgi:hypothetical protein
LNYTEKLEQNPRCRRRYRDSLMNYIMSMLPMDHEKTIALFAERALLEAFQNGKQDSFKGPTGESEIKKRHDKPNSFQRLPGAQAGQTEINKIKKR